MDEDKKSPEEITDNIINTLVGDTNAPVNKPAEGATDKPAEGTADKPAEGTADKPAEGTADKPAEGTAEGDAKLIKPSPMWEALKEKMLAQGAAYDLPEAIKQSGEAGAKTLSQKEEFDLLTNEIIQNVNIEEHDPFVAAYKAEKASREAAKEGFDYDRFIDGYKAKINVENLEPKQFLTHVMKLEAEKQKTGWTDNDISEYLDSKNKIELYEMSKEAKSKYKESLIVDATEKEQKAIAAQKESYLEDIKQINVKIEARVSELATEMLKEGFIGGIPHGQSDAKEFLEFFKQQVVLDSETGRPEISKMFDDDKTLYRTLFLSWMADKGRFVDFKEQNKQEVLSKTGLQRRSEGGAGIAKKTAAPKVDDFFL